MSQIRSITIFALLLVIPAVAAMAADEIHPNSLQLAVDYELSGNSVATDQTLAITRVIRNNESYPITGIYFSDNLPPQFTITFAEISRNGNPVTFESTGPVAGEIENGYDLYRWMIDSPDPGSPTQFSLNPGDSVILYLEVACSEVGDYQLPLHTISGFGNGAGLFAVSGPVALSIVEPADIISPAAVSDLQVELTTP